MAKHVSKVSWSVLNRPNFDKARFTVMRHQVRKGGVRVSEIHTRRKGPGIVGFHSLKSDRKSSEFHVGIV